MKEEFCPPCLAAIPLAFAATSTGASAAIDDGSNHSDKKKAKLKRTLLLVGVTVGSLALTFLFIWFMFFKNKCTTCK